MAVKWYGDKLRKEIETKCLKNMGTACLFLEGQIKQSISGPSPSAPHEPPGVVTGTFRRSITHEVEKTPDGVIGRVGSGLKDPPYPLYLELGTSTMAARPWARTNLEKNKKPIARILTSGK